MKSFVVARGGTLGNLARRFCTNAPASGASIEIDTPAGLLKPRERDDGTYTVDAPFLSTPGKYDLAITVTVADKVDLLAATLTCSTTRASGPYGARHRRKTVPAIGQLGPAAVAGFIAGSSR